MSRIITAKHDLLAEDPRARLDHDEAPGGLVSRLVDLPEAGVRGLHLEAGQINRGDVDLGLDAECPQLNSCNPFGARAPILYLSPSREAGR
jgi:hypothetical protein